MDIRAGANASMPVYLIGPSCAGKSTHAKDVVAEWKKVTECPNLAYVDLDAEIRTKNCALFCQPVGRWDAFWTVAENCIEEVKQRSVGIKLIDCGAGCLQTPQALEFFQSQRYVIALVADPRVLFERAKVTRGWKCVQDYINSEFSTCRQRFYNAAKFKVDVTELSPQGPVSIIYAILAGIKTKNGAK